MLPEYVKFYYDKLPEIKKAVYMQMYKGLREHKKRIIIKTDTSIISSDDLMYIFKCLYNDTPSFYFVDLSLCKFIKITTGYVFIKDFIYSEEKIKGYDKAIVEGLKIFKDRYIRDEMSDYEKEMVIHDYLVKTVTYDEESIKEEEQHIRHGEIYNILGPLLRKKAVCWGIACAFKLICDYCQIKCFVVVGDALPIIEGAAGHAWNIVRLEDENYHVDVTWDIKKKGDISFIYDYLNLDDHLIKMDHAWNDGIYPPCKALKYNYYNRNKLYVRKLDQIPDYIRNSIASGGKFITFKFANEMPEKERIREWINIGIRQVNFHGSYTWAINMEIHNVYIDLS
jgi:transglutaminase-like protein